MKILGIIPARFASTRFPGKALTDICGKTMIQRVYEQATKAKTLSAIIVATDHTQIYDHVLNFGGKVMMTRTDHLSGTDRCNEVLQSISAEEFDYVINIQGDEPFIDPKQIEIVSSFLDGNTQLATLAKKIEDLEVLFNPNVVKLVLNKFDEAIYFSREAIPHCRGIEKKSWLTKQDYFKHIGIYAYRVDILAEITHLAPSSLELTESLEQLRWLENGYKIKVGKTELETVGIDTPDDLEKIKSYLGEG